MEKKPILYKLLLFVWATGLLALEIFEIGNGASVVSIIWAIYLAAQAICSEIAHTKEKQHGEP